MGILCLGGCFWKPRPARVLVEYRKFLISFLQRAAKAGAGRLTMKRTLLLSIVILTVAVACSPPPGIEEGHIDVNGTSLFYKAIGSGEPIVVLHGGPGFDHRQFLPYIWELATQHRVILYDQRGMGLSSGPVDATSINIDTFIADLEGIREAFGIEGSELVIARDSGHWLFVDATETFRTSILEFLARVDDL